jgi:hypothetical protein
LMVILLLITILIRLFSYGSDPSSSIFKNK